MSVQIWNESALGIYTLCWNSKHGTRNEISWFDGLAEPMFSFYSLTVGKMLPPMPIRNPARFGHWPLSTKSHARTFVDFKAFVTAFAEACEKEE